MTLKPCIGVAIVGGLCYIPSHGTSDSLYIMQYVNRYSRQMPTALGTGYIVVLLPVLNFLSVLHTTVAGYGRKSECVALNFVY